MHTHTLEEKGWKIRVSTNGNIKQTGILWLNLSKHILGLKLRDKESYYIVIKGSVQQQQQEQHHQQKHDYKPMTYLAWK